MPRVRVEFAKGDQVRFLSHLDLMKTIERVIRRAEIPIAFSEGFNPHPKMNFASALAVGVTSDSEYMDIELREETELGDILRRLSKALPPGIEIKQGRIVADTTPALMAMVNRASYIVLADVEQHIASDVLNDSVARFMEKTEVLIMKRTKKGPKEKNIRPGILYFEAQPVGNDIEFTVTTVVSNEGNVRPEEVIGAFAKSSGLPIDCETIRIRRTGLFVEKDSRRYSPMDD
ncbi:MAG TPA: TIGR03936 family radical SAM-associated protein [Desulfobacteria bacterium]|nr:TIGR03936 family radical SAM-associated protein [Desulfobacteria bacterium]